LASRGCCLTSTVTPLPALLLLAAAAAVARGWWSFWDNAFSDLGNPRYDFTSAVMFNLGLYTSALLLVIVAAYCLSGLHAAVRGALAAVGYSLGLVAVYSEVYHGVHFAVSALFFLSILAFTVAYAATLRTPHIIGAAVAADAISIIFWYTHFALDTPPGAAPPELVSVIVLLAFYYHATLRSARLCSGGGE
jgi:hypothetical membrane protein